ncbi:M66 family metalloprotease [Enterovibrio norvegicus]|uniref:Peptidase M66 n=2 Tax=Enterovibrio norvegicus TaxID=188144 RepID=A0A1I5WG98_9GAMM|nr:M66 family metalloprotease [Enterovibrio norvegicus]SFQ18782.1 Peptidase M66 [Enterovibrio norvegicus DSM 15893]
MQKRSLHRSRISTSLAIALALASPYVLAETNTAASPVATFNNNFYNDLEGALSGYVMFAQHAIIPAKQHIPNDTQPHLTGARNTLVMMKLSERDKHAKQVRVSVFDKDNALKAQFDMASPDALPSIAGSGLSAGLNTDDFKIPSAYDRSFSGTSTLKKFEDASFFTEQLKQFSAIQLKTADGAWVSTFTLPDSNVANGRTVVVSSEAGYRSTVKYSGKRLSVNRGETRVFRYLNGSWFSDVDANAGRVKYGDFWSVAIDATFIEPGVSFAFTANGKQGTLKGVNVGAPTQVFLNTIDVGMLTPNRDQFEMQTQPELIREYFQQTPTSKLIVNNFTPLHFKEVMMPDGTLLTDFAPDTGGVHKGSMRETIGKRLMSLGINNANYGIHSSAPGGSHPYATAQISAHNTLGRYENGVVVHGLSGGAGIVTLLNSKGNEFSHELGHNYGMGHYPGGFNGSVHRPPNAVNSTWGWDADTNTFIPNFSRVKTDKATCLNDQCQEAFEGFAFNKDAMAGGGIYDATYNNYTLHTPYTAQRIQRFLENKAVFDTSSPTGFSTWNNKTQAMEAWTLKVDNATTATAGPSQVSKASLTALLSTNTLINISFSNGDWTRDIYLPNAKRSNTDKVISIAHRAGYTSSVHVNNTVETIQNGNTWHYVSNGKTWNRTNKPDLSVARIPKKQGIPITTLFGYYDPENKLRSYVYPATHGAYGMTYAQDGANATCQLNVETRRKGTLHFALSDKRFSANQMNQFNVNIERSAEVLNAEVRCNGKTLSTRQIDATDVKPTVTTIGGDNVTKPKGCIVSLSSGAKYCLSVGKSAGYSLPSWINRHEVYVQAEPGAKVVLSDYDNLSYRRIASFEGTVENRKLSNVLAQNGDYIDFSTPRSMRVEQSSTPLGCIVSLTTREQYCLPANQRSGYALPSWIRKHEVYVYADEGVKVRLGDWPNLSYNRTATFSQSMTNEELKSVKARNGQYLDFSRPQSMEVK